MTTNKMTQEIKKWWNMNAEMFRQDQEAPIDVSYGPGISNEDELRLLENVKGKKVIELGCGSAQCSIALAKKGARVTGVDISKTQLEYAKKSAIENKVKIALEEGSFTNIKMIKSNIYDIAFSSWSLQYCDNLLKCFEEANRVLKKEGIFVLSLPHPFWDIIDKRDMKVRRNYFTMKRQKESYGKGTFIWYNHTIESISENLAKSGFTIERILEPNPKNKDKRTKTVKIAKYKKEGMKLIPRTIIFKARKT